jgi:hypothetical protein
MMDDVVFCSNAALRFMQNDSKSTVNETGTVVRYKRDDYSLETPGGWTPQETRGPTLSDLASTEWSLSMTGSRWQAGVLSTHHANKRIVYCFGAKRLLNKPARGLEWVVENELITVQCDLANQTITFMLNNVKFAPYKCEHPLETCQIWIELNDAEVGWQYTEKAEFVPTPSRKTTTTTAPVYTQRGVFPLAFTASTTTTTEQVQTCDIHRLTRDPPIFWGISTSILHPTSSP